MKIGTFLTTAEGCAIIKQLGDWSRTISAGSMILGLLNPAIQLEPELVRQALVNVGLPSLALCLICSVIVAKVEQKKGG